MRWRNLFHSLLIQLFQSCFFFFLAEVVGSCYMRSVLVSLKFFSKLDKLDAFQKSIGAPVLLNQIGTNRVCMCAIRDMMWLDGEINSIVLLEGKVERNRAEKRCGVEGMWKWKCGTCPFNYLSAIRWRSNERERREREESSTLNRAGT